MKVKKNRHTLKRRIRRAMFLCILITVLLFGGIMTYLATSAFRVEAYAISKSVSKNISENMNSSEFLAKLNIKYIEDINLQGPGAKEWVDSLDETSKLKDIFSFFGPMDKIYIQITINNRIIYSNMFNRNNDGMPVIYDKNGMVIKPHRSALVQSLLEYYKDTASTSPIMNTAGMEVGNVTVSINPGFILDMCIALVAIIIGIGILSMIIAYIISKFLVIPILTPLNHLDKKIKQIAAGNIDSTTNTQIEVKNPLREIQSLADSTNQVMNKVREYADLLSSQNKILEEQNSELEAQNEELINSKRQLQEAQTQLVQNENMASIGQLTAAIAHEINTPLGAINSNSQLIQMILNIISENNMVKSDMELSESISQLVQANDVSLMAGKRVTDIIGSLKRFSKIDGAEFQESDINEGIKSVLVLTSNLWKKRITIHEDYCSSAVIKCFPGLLNQVFMNIIVNAIQAIENNGHIFIKTWNDENSLYVSIRDTGSGIPDENLPKIFEPMFTTKNEASGMGLGLSITRNIIEKHHGDIEVKSKLGQGTEFSITLPRHIG